MVHLHTHSVYSLLDGACAIKKLVRRAKELGQSALAITDHGYMYGIVEFVSACKAEGIKPIIGVELYTTPNIHEKEKEMGHLVLLAKSQEGYKNLIKVESIAATEGFYYKPRCDLELLSRYHEGLICLSGCLSGDVSKLLLADKFAEAKELAAKYQAIFGEDYYIEVQNHGLEDQKKVMPGLMQIAKELGIRMVATNDVHYIKKEDALAQRVLMCIGMGRLVSDKEALGYGMPKEFYLKSEEEMRQIFAPELVDETDAIAAKCNVDFDDMHKGYKLPDFPTPDGWDDNYSYLRALCRAGLQKRYGDEAKTHLPQLEYELETIKKMGFVDYMLIVSDFIGYAKRNGIGVGPGRGSAAGSIVAYCLGITTLDPVKYALKFERFLNPERITMPDIDVDFDPSDREEVVAYVARKYGQGHVAQIVTFQTLGAKSAIRDVGKALGMTPKETSKLSSMVPKTVTTIDEAYKASAALRKAAKEDVNIRRVLLIAKEIEGTPRNTSVHAAGVILAPNDVDHYIPVCRNVKGTLALSQFDMGGVEKTGMLKVDFLGLKTLGIIRDAENRINAHWDDPDDKLSVWTQPLDHAGVYEMLARGDSKGVFQLESDGIRDVLRKLKPTCFEDIIAVVALYRPGPMDSIPAFIEGKNHPETVTYAHPLLEPILSTTYGQIIYQEQVMEIVRTMAGYSYGRSDLVRRAMSKKKPEVLAAEKDIFINGKLNPDGTIDVEGCLRRGVPLDVAEKLWDEMSSFAAYAFNKAHAAVYADLAYRTAFLRCVFPVEYQAAVLTNAVGSNGKFLSLLDDCEKSGIKVLPPDINLSQDVFIEEGENIRFGLMAIKDAGKATVQEIVSSRCDKPFRDLVDLMERVPTACDKGTLTALLKSGALDSFPQNRAQMFAVLPTLLKKASALRKNTLKEQMTLEEGFFTTVEQETRRGYTLGAVKWPDLPDLPLREKLDQEMEAISLYISGNPLAEYQDVITQKVTCKAHEITAKVGEGDEAEYVIPGGADVRVAAVISQIKNITTKKDKRAMCSMTVVDQGGQFSATVFPKAYEAYGPRLKMGEPVILFGKIDDDDSFGRKLIVNGIDFLRPEQPQQ